MNWSWDQLDELPEDLIPVLIEYVNDEIRKQNES